MELHWKLYHPSTNCVRMCATYRSFATRVSQLRIRDFSGEAFKGFEVV